MINKNLIVGIFSISITLYAFLSIGWVGYLATDDRAYISTAEEWLTSAPVIPGSHWSERHPLILAISASFSIFGNGEWQSILPSLLYGIGLIVVVFIIAYRGFGVVCATAVSLTLVATPLISQDMSLASVEVVEAFYVISSLFIFLAAIERAGSALWLVVSGVAAGIAFLSRETAGALVVFYILCFLFIPTIERWRYFLIGGGFLLVVGAEMLYFALVAGNPLLRFEIALESVGVANPEDPGTGNITTNRWLGPIFSLLVNNEFGLLFWLTIAAVIYLWHSRPGLSSTQSRLLVYTGILGLVWWLIVGYALDLRALPRYYTVSVISSSVVFGIAVWHLFNSGATKLPVLLMAIFIATSLALTDLSNQQPLLAERSAVELVKNNSQATIYTDPRTAWRSERLAQWAGIKEGRILGIPPKPGGLYFYSEPALIKGKAGPSEPFDTSKFKPSSTWTIHAVLRGNPTYIGRIIRWMGLESTVESIGLNRLIWETPPITIYEGDFTR